MQDGWEPSPLRGTGTRLQPALTTLCPLALDASTRIASTRRRRVSEDWMAELSLDVACASLDRSDHTSVLEDYLLRLLCSRYPSEFKRVARPSNLLSGPLPPSPDRLRRTSRLWHFQVVQTSSKKISVAASPEESDDAPTARQLWLNLRRTRAALRTAILDLSPLAQADEPIGDEAEDTEMAADVEWLVLKTAARQELFEEDPGESVADADIASQISIALSNALVQVFEEQEPSHQQRRFRATRSTWRFAQIGHQRAHPRTVERQPT